MAVAIHEESGSAIVSQRQEDGIVHGMRGAGGGAGEDDVESQVPG